MPQERFGFPTALAVKPHARRLFKVVAKLFGTRADELTHRALGNDGVAFRSEPRSREELLHVAAAHGLTVDRIRGVAVARDDALHGEFRIGAPGAFERPVRFEDQLHARASELRAGRGAREDEFGHAGFAAQFRGAPFAQHPPHGVDDVRLAAAVRAHDGRERNVDVDDGEIGEAFEAGDFDLSKTHVG